MREDNGEQTEEERGGGGLGSRINVHVDTVQRCWITCVKLEFWLNVRHIFVEAASEKTFQT